MINQSTGCVSIIQSHFGPNVTQVSQMGAFPLDRAYLLLGQELQYDFLSSSGQGDVSEFAQGKRNKIMEYVPVLVERQSLTTPHRVLCCFRTSLKQKGHPRQGSISHLSLLPLGFEDTSSDAVQPSLFCPGWPARSIEIAALRFSILMDEGRFWRLQNFGSWSVWIVFMHLIGMYFV